MLRRMRSPRRLGALLLALLAAACQPPADAELRVDSVSPATVPAGVDSGVQLLGVFEPAVFTDFAHPDRSAIGDGFEVRLGDVALVDVHLDADGTLRATVPASVPAGAHPLVVTSPDGRSAALHDAYPVHGPVARLAVSVPSTPPGEALPFELTVTAVDDAGLVVGSYLQPVAISLTPGGGLSCLSGCEVDTLKTLPLQQGRWTGAVSILVPGTGRQIAASSGAFSGLSAPFDVRMRTPPEVPRLRLPVVVFPGSGGTVMVDAALVRDRHTPPEKLEVSLGLGATLDGTQVPGTEPWSAFAPGRVLFKRTESATAYARVAGRDDDGDVGFGPRHLVATVAPEELCLVTTNHPKDDGATDCFGALGLDQQLSLPEAIRLANARPGRQVITFSLDAIPTNAELARTASDADTLNVTDPLWILAPTVAGQELVLSGWNWNLASTDILLSGFTVTWGSGLQGTVTVAPGAQVRMVRTTLRDFVGLVVNGTALLEDVELRRCYSTACIRVGGAGASVTMRGGALSAGTSLPFFDDGIVAASCGSGATPVVDVSGVVFAGIPQEAIRQDTTCARPVIVRHDTFHEVGTGVALSGGSGHWVTDNLFTHLGTPVACGSALFANGARGRNLLFAIDGSTGCLLGDPGNLYADPRYVDPASDLRLQRTSPAKDAAADHGLDVNGVGPGLYLGEGPDLGGRETW